MRTLLPSRLLRPGNAVLNVSSKTSTINPSASAAARCNPRACLRNCRCFAHVHDIDKLNRDVWFTSTVPRSSLASGEKPPDERTLQLGKTVRTLHERLPSLLQSPLPSDILSPQISLHLFPSTHPHLPTVSGRIAYVAALWTAPVAWGRVPLVGNVKLTILSERMVRNGGSTSSGEKWREENLIVKWKTCGKTHHRDASGGTYQNNDIGNRDPVDRIRSFIAGTTTISSPLPRLNNSAGDGKDEEFTGLFIFSFDEQGRIVKHVIEHTEEGGHWDRMTRVVSVTDWLFGQFNGSKKREQMPELAWCQDQPPTTIMDRSRQRQPR